jgi:hypothetical protein
VVALYEDQHSFQLSEVTGEFPGYLGSLQPHIITFKKAEIACYLDITILSIGRIQKKN